jgi:cell cycle checkpoint protein
MVSRIMRSRRQVPQQPEQQPRARWTNGVTKVFLDMMVDQVQRGNRISNSFSKKAWKHMSAEFYRKTSLRWDLEQLKSKYAVLRRQYAIASSLLERSEFSLDESTGMISANDEAWAAYIKVCSFCCCFLQLKTSPALD